MKRLVLVRHAEAESKRPGQGDLQRKLTATGVEEARKVGRALAALYERVDVVASSKAVRAVQTADQIATAFSKCLRMELEALNPGCGGSAFRQALTEMPAEVEIAIWVGHEPDLSEMLASAIGSDGGRFRFKKLACAELGWDEEGRAELVAFMPPRILTKYGRV